MAAYALQEPIRSIADPIVKVFKRYYWFNNCLNLLRGLLDDIRSVRNGDFGLGQAAVPLWRDNRRRSSATLRIEKSENAMSKMLFLDGFSSAHPRFYLRHW